MKNPISRVTLFDSKLSDFKKAKKEWASKLFKLQRVGRVRSFAAPASAAPEDNVVGVGIGEKVTDNLPTGVMAVKFFVSKKYPKEQLLKRHVLPPSIGGLPVDVEETGLFHRFTTVLPNPRTKIRPAQPGCSIGFQDPQNQFVMAGTFGAVVKNGNEQFVLSNNHVLADENRLAAGAPIFQPGLLDHGDPATDRIAALARFIPLSPAGNKVDCAIAKVDSNNLVSKDVLHIGPPAGTADAALGMEVHKFGRTTSYTVGMVKSTDTDVKVGYE